MSKPRLLDLFCGAGGAAMGYYRAGFEIVGVDIKPQPHYPFEFHQADALDFLGFSSRPTWDVIHASPPCQLYSSATPRSARVKHKDLIPPTRALLREIGLPYVIENVPGSPLRATLMLCGSMFGLGVDRFEVRRHRYFEIFPDLMILPPPCQHGLAEFTIDLAGGGGANNPHRHRKGTAIQRRAALGAEWMTRDEISQAIPPAYTEWIGKQLMAHLEGRMALVSRDLART